MKDITENLISFQKDIQILQSSLTEIKHDMKEILKNQNLNQTQSALLEQKVKSQDTKLGNHITNCREDKKKIWTEITAQKVKNATISGGISAFVVFIGWLISR